MHLCAQENNFGKRKRTKHQNQPGTNQSKNNLNTSIKKMRFIRPKGRLVSRRGQDQLLISTVTPRTVVSKKKTTWVISLCKMVHLVMLLHKRNFNICFIRGKERERKPESKTLQEITPSDKQMSYLKKLCATSKKNAANRNPFQI